MIPSAPTAPALPGKDTTWQHTSGKRYVVLMLTNLDATRPDYPVTVVYEEEHRLYSNAWSRPLADWHRSMTEV